jgi:AraC family transcriptional regulator
VTGCGLPAPVASSRQRRWNGIVVERYRTDDVNVVARLPLALVTLHLGPPVALVQTRHKQVYRRRINRGDITVTPPGEPKEWRHRGHAEFAALWLAPALIKRIAAEASGIKPERVEILHNFGTRDSQIERIGLSLLSELEHEGFGARLYVESLANELAVHLLRRYSTAGVAARPSATMLPGYKLRRVTEYMNDNLGKDVTLSGIARTLGMSPYHFARVFKQTTGLAPHQYLMARRVARAKSLLRETDLSITEIAHRVGCTSQSHFSVLFHRATAITPRMFRQER